MARSPRMASAIFGPGDSHFTEKRRSLCPLTWVPSPSVKRPPEAFCRSHAMCAMIIGLRENTVAMLVPSLMRDVHVAATASGRNGSCWVSDDQRVSYSMASTLRAYSAVVLRSWVSMPTSSFTVEGLLERKSSVLRAPEHTRGSHPDQPRCCGNLRGHTSLLGSPRRSTYRKY